MLIETACQSFNISSEFHSTINNFPRMGSMNSMTQSHSSSNEWKFITVQLIGKMTFCLFIVFHLCSLLKKTRYFFLLATFFPLFSIKNIASSIHCNTIWWRFNGIQCLYDKSMLKQKEKPSFDDEHRNTIRCLVWFCFFIVYFCRALFLPQFANSGNSRQNRSLYIEG